LFGRRFGVVALPIASQAGALLAARVSIRAMRTVIAAALVAAGLTACSSSGGGSGPSPSTDSGATVQGYVDAVNALCQQLLPKILAVTHDGDPAKFTVAQYRASVPAHQALVAGFDQHFAAIPVPPAARGASAAMRAYIAYATTLDAQRLAAAGRGQAAYEATIQAQVAAYPTSAVKQARDAAGFDASCDAR
jgi:hypothetical protein